MLDDTKYASIPDRIKAFIVDAFLIYTPILYIITYVVLDGSDDFQNSPFAPIIAIAIFGFISSVFISISGQTPGKKAYTIRIVDNNTKEKISFLRAYLRFVLMLFSCAFLVGIIISFYRRDRRAFHDLALNTSVVIDE